VQNGASYPVDYPLILVSIPQPFSEVNNLPVGQFKIFTKGVTAWLGSACCDGTNREHLHGAALGLSNLRIFHSRGPKVSNTYGVVSKAGSAACYHSLCDDLQHYELATVTVVWQLRHSNLSYRRQLGSVGVASK